MIMEGNIIPIVTNNTIKWQGIGTVRYPTAAPMVSNLIPLLSQLAPSEQVAHSYRV